MTVDDIEVLLKDTEHNGYPVVVSRENQYLVGFVLRKDLNLALGNFFMIINIVNNNNYLICRQPMQREILTAYRVNRW
jgi:hypothetical protein